LGIDIRWALLVFLFTPAVLYGLKKDTKPLPFIGNVSFWDHAFFYTLITTTAICVIFLYQIDISVKVVFITILTIAGISLYTFCKDVAPYAEKPKLKYEGFDVWVDLFFVLIIVFFIRSFILSPFQIIGPSMESTFHGGSIRGNEYGDGEFILVDKMTYQIETPKRGDVVVFTPRVGPEKRYLIKRIIGLPGDTVRVQNGFVFVATAANPTNFVQLDEVDYLREKYGNTCLSYSQVGCKTESEDFVVPEGKYFLMGDNRPQSLDARKCFHSSGCTDVYREAQFVPLSAISGRVALSLGHFDLFEQFFMPNSYIPYPKIGTLKQVVDFRWNNIQNTHTYTELVRK
jgi:signal peptidase I